mgnify:CR=1 FL=1
MGRQALELGADTFQFFTRNPRGSRAKDLDTADAAVLADLLRERHFAPIIAHAPYTLNLCGAQESNRTFARDTMADDLRRLEYLPGQYYNFHPGSHVGQGVERGISYIAEGLNAILRENQTTTVLLETMAGKGSEVGGRFEELREILDRVTLTEQMGVCLDTCHTFTAGYDFLGDYDAVFNEFEEVVGFRYLRGMHLNDSKKELGSHVDRHDSIGKGLIGFAFFEKLMRDPRFDNIPLILETIDETLWPEEIAWLREQSENK